MNQQIPKCVCVIPARGGSSRIPRKNIKEFHGKPIIAYSIEAAKASKLFDAIFVSTDDYEIAEIAAQFGATPLKRDEGMECDEVGTQQVMKSALERIGGNVTYACCLYATVPMVSVDDLRDAYDILIGEAGEYVVPVATWLRDPGQFYFGTVDAFLNEVDLIGGGTILLKSDPERECDINTIEDWERAEIMYTQLQEGK